MINLLYYKLIIISNQILTYIQKIKFINYITILIKLNIFFVCLKLLYYLKNPLPQYQKAVKRILQYLWGTKNLTLEFGDTSFNINIFLIYFNTAFADIINSRKSSIGYIFQLYNRSIAWKTSKQLTVTISNTEAELLALMDAGKKMII